MSASAVDFTCISCSGIPTPIPIFSDILMEPVNSAPSGNTGSNKSKIATLLP